MELLVGVYERRRRALGRSLARHERLYTFLTRPWDPGRPRHWRRPRKQIAAQIGRVLGLLLLGLVAVSVGTVAWSLFTGEPLLGITMRAAKRRCEDTGFACNIATSIFFTALPLAIGSFLFVFRRLRKVRRQFVKQARNGASDLVETAGEIVGRVVGRDDLCNVLQQDLRDASRRRPHVLVGGVGVGKTAVLVRLTELLARRGAVPVPVRLRDAGDEVDFLDLARRRFLRATEGVRFSEAEGERVWQQLCQNDQIVVLADGLEEALADSNVRLERHHRVRVAVNSAHARGYPLVIASRPHDALTGLGAALIHLEPLSAEAAIEYIEEGQAVDDPHRLSWLLDTASVVDTPLYLQIARELHENGRLDAEHVDTRGADRVKLCVELMHAWIAALIEGKLEKSAAVPLTRDERKAAVTQISALACVGLARDTLQPTFDMYEKLDDGAVAPEPRYPALHDAVCSKLRSAMTPPHAWAQAASPPYATDPVDAARRHARASVNMQVAVSMGLRLGLVEQQKDGVRFPHSMMQAYLGARLMAEAWSEEEYKRRALTRPGRELLSALVMRSRVDDRDFVFVRADVRDELIAAADNASQAPKVLELLAAAIEIDSVEPSSKHRQASAKAAEKWTQLASSDDATHDAKLKLIERLGDATRRLSLGTPEEVQDADLVGIAQDGEPQWRDSGSGRPLTPCWSYGLYRDLYTIGCAEDAYPIRLAAAHEIGSGGEIAWHELEKLFEKTLPMSNASGGPALDAVRQTMHDAVADPAKERELSLQAWLLPMLVGSSSPAPDVAGRKVNGRPQQRLDTWLDVAREGMPLALEAALAQGFKYAANRRPRHPYERLETRGYLAHAAWELLKHADFWFSRLTLLHALCLWALSGTTTDEARGTGSARRNFQAVVERWLRRADGGTEHRFVQEAAALVVKALETGHPERFIWIDESGIVTNVGSRPRGPIRHSLRRLWIEPSAGSLALAPRAQQLVADVLILLNLAERGAVGREREDRLHQINLNELPYCLTSERRRHLRPARTIGVAQATPSDTCKGGCPVNLCPYPPKGEQPYRVELPEAFCRNQQAILTVRHALGGRAAGWQDTSRSELLQFWAEMERRARL
ncbi:MAG: hypothetical protein M3N47_08735 [Chloroflexota bacterium]|nr:hypothetical protein [Chloroflexota bacterium]